MPSNLLEPLNLFKKSSAWFSLLISRNRRRKKPELQSHLPVVSEDLLEVERIQSASRGGSLLSVSAGGVPFRLLASLSVHQKDLAAQSWLHPAKCISQHEHGTASQFYCQQKLRQCSNAQEKT